MFVSPDFRSGNSEAVEEVVHHWDGHFLKTRLVAKYGSAPSHFEPSAGYSWRRETPPESLLKLLFYEGGISWS